MLANDQVKEVELNRDVRLDLELFSYEEMLEASGWDEPRASVPGPG